jgi:hypothetical protein
VNPIRDAAGGFVVNVAGSRLGALKDAYAIRRAAIETGSVRQRLPVASALALAMRSGRGNMKPRGGISFPGGVLNGRVKTVALGSGLVLA